MADEARGFGVSRATSERERVRGSAAAYLRDAWAGSEAAGRGAALTGFCLV